MDAHALKPTENATLGGPGSVELARTRRLLANAEGWVTVRGGRVWLTRDGDLNDYVLGPGERMPLWQGDRVTAEGWQSGEAAWLEWQPVHQPLPMTYLAATLAGGFARGARGLAGGLLALARNAEAKACRAQGNICSGESMASAGALQ